MPERGCTDRGRHGVAVSRWRSHRAARWCAACWRRFAPSGERSGVPPRGVAGAVGGSRGRLKARRRAESRAARAGASSVASAIFTAAGSGWPTVRCGSSAKSVTPWSATTTVDLGASWFVSARGLHGRVGRGGDRPDGVLRRHPGDLPPERLRCSCARFSSTCPLALLLTGVAMELVRLSLWPSPTRCPRGHGGVGRRERHRPHSPVARVLGGTSASVVRPIPAFAVFFGALLVASGAFVLWLELVVRAAAVSVAVLFLPLSMAALVWPAISHWCRRLADTSGRPGPVQVRHRRSALAGFRRAWRGGRSAVFFVRRGWLGRILGRGDRCRTAAHRHVGAVHAAATDSGVGGWSDLASRVGPSPRQERGHGPHAQQRRREG